MNELIPIQQDDILILDEMSIARFPLFNNRIFIFIIPVFLFILLRDQNRFPKQSLTNYEKPNVPTVDTNSLDKMSNLLGSLKKATALNDLRRSMLASGNAGRPNMDFLKEVLNLFSGSMNEESKSHVQTIGNVLSLLGKVKDVKNIMNIQKALKTETDGDMTAKIDNIIEAVKPMLPPEQLKNVDNFKKMAQMMKLMSLFDGSNDEDNENENNEEFKEEPVEAPAEE